MEKQDWQGKYLDKDIITPGNKIYCPDSCCFISAELNQLFSVTHSGNSGLPIGVKDKQDRSGYEAFIRHNGKRIYLGYHLTSQSAHVTWQKEKLKIVDEFLALNSDLPDNVYQGVMLRKIKLENAICNKSGITGL